MSLEMELQPIQLKHQLCAIIQYRNRLMRFKIFGTLPLPPTVCSRFGTIATLLTRATERTTRFQLNTDNEHVSEQLKDCVSSSPILVFPSMKERSIMYTLGMSV